MIKILPALFMIFLMIMGEANAMCLDGTTASCSVEGKIGTKECIGGRWGTCEVDEQSNPGKCRDGTAGACFIDGNHGIKLCKQGQWGACVIDKQSTDPIHVCAREGGAPVRTFSDEEAAIAQSPGRKKIAFILRNSRDALLILVDDAPGLSRDQMRVEIDIDPNHGVVTNKAIEAWGFCRQGSRVSSIEASMIGGFNVGTACWDLDPANDFRSGCTKTQTMLLNRRTTSELWLRKPGFLGIWTDAQGIDSSIWKAFGGRSVRFIWRIN